MSGVAACGRHALSPVYKKTMFLHVFLDFCGSLVLGFRVSCLFGGGLAPPCFPVNGQKTSCLGSVLDPIWGWATRTHPSQRSFKKRVFFRGQPTFFGGRTQPKPNFEPPRIDPEPLKIDFALVLDILPARFFSFFSPVLGLGFWAGGPAWINV